MTEAEYRDKVRAALVEGLMGFEGSAYNEETMQMMMDKVIEIWPPRDPIQWVESVKIEGGVAHYKLTPEAVEIFRAQGWKQMDDKPRIQCGAACEHTIAIVSDVETDICRRCGMIIKVDAARLAGDDA